MEINKCLEDPNTQYSDQYMPLAMMPAVVEAIQKGGGQLIVNGVLDEDEEYEVLDKTFTEIETAINNGTPCFIKHDDYTSIVPILGALHIADNYVVVTVQTIGQNDVQYLSYEVASADGYPKALAD